MLSTSTHTHLLPLHREKLRNLFLNNSFKSFHLHYQSLDPRDLSSIWFNDLSNRNFLDFQFLNDSFGCISLQELYEFSQFLGVQVASIPDFLFSSSTPKNPQLLFSLIQNSIANAKASSFKFLVARIPLANTLAVSALLSNQFYFVCGESTLTCNLSKLPPHHSFAPHPCVRVASLEDLDQVQELSVVAHQDIRYLFDPNFDPIRVKSFYSLLPQRALLSNPSRQLLVYYENHKILGYLSFGINSRLRSLPLRYASLDYIAVHPSIHGRGIGHALNTHALFLLQKCSVHAVSVRTMASNYPAIAVLLKNHFRVTDQNIILHHRIS